MKLLLSIILALCIQSVFCQNIELLSKAQVINEYELTQTAFCSNGSDRADSSGPRFDGTMESRGVSYKNYQYVTYYESDGSIVVARRNLDMPDTWERSVLLGHKMVKHDRHRKIAIGISEGDGVIHLTFDHHNEKTFNYAKTSVGVAENPENVVWDDAVFSLLPNLGLTVDPGDVTYPEFYQLHGTKDIIVYWRSGGAIKGEMNLAHYNTTTHSWSFIGEISSRYGSYKGVVGTRGPYGAGFHSDANGYLHTGWVWREEIKVDGDYNYNNHGLYYAYSKDGGFSWHNTIDTLIADTRKGEAISINNIGGPVIEIPISSEPSNAQIYSAVDGVTGDFHFFSTHKVKGSSTKKAHQYIRKANGEWSVVIGEVSGGGGSIFIGNDYAFITRGSEIYYSTRDLEFKKWTNMPLNKSLPSGDANWDASRINEGILSYVVQLRPGSLGKPSPVKVVDVKVAEKSTTVGTNETPKFGFSMYPNPANNFLKIQFNNAINRKAELSVFDINGKIALSELVSSNHQIDISNLVSGIYLVQVQMDEHYASERLVKL